MSYQRSQTPTTAPQQAPFASSQAPTFSPLLGLQGLIGNAGVLEMLRPQMPSAQRERRPTPPTGAVQSVLQQGASNLTPPPAGIETPSSAVATTLADQGQGAAVTSAPSSPTTSAAAQVTALDETQGGVEGAITDSPTLTTAVADELGSTPSNVTAQAQDAWQPSWWDEAVDWTVGGVGSLVDGGVDLLSDVPVLGTASAKMAPVTKFAWETLGGFAKGAGDFVGGLGHMVAHPLDTLSGLATMAEHIPGSPLKPLHKLYDVATTDKTLEETFWRNPLDVAKEDLSADWDFWKGVGGALLDPYERSVEQGKYGEALGRGIFDIGSMFVGAGEVKALGKGAEAVSVLNKVDDAVKVASKVNELGAVTDDIVRAGGKVDDLTKAASHADDVADLSKADDATKLGNQAEGTTSITDSSVEAVQTSGKTPSGARYVEEAAPETVARYEKIRQADDVAGMAEKLGVPEDVIARVKHHLFEAEHDLPVGPDEVRRGRFTPDEEIARLWEAASSGTIGPEDTLALKRLLSHEYVERGLMETGMPYRSTHPGAWEDGTNFPTPMHHGAHDLSPLVDPGRAPFGHLRSLLGGIPEGLALADDLTNLDDVVRLILEKKGGT